MGALTDLREALVALIVEARGLDVGSLMFSAEGTARLGAIALLGVAAGVLLLRMLTRRTTGRGRLALPSLIEWARPSRITLLRHGALVCALAGIPFFALALADPKTALMQEQASYPGRRITLMLSLIHI